MSVSHRIRNMLSHAWLQNAQVPCIEKWTLWVKKESKPSAEQKKRIDPEAPDPATSSFGTA
eukprot:6291062-Prymnesium_polylepis.1